MEILKYSNQDEYEKLIAEKTAQGLVLTNVSNVKEGNFLGFKELSELKTPIEQKLEEISTKLDAILKLIQK